MSKASFEVVWAEPAARDPEELISFIAAESPINARKLLDRLRRRAATLDELPGRGRLVPELRELGLREVRELLLSPYRLLYRITGAQVIVLALLDGRRDLDDLLYERLIRGTD
ncbi:MAG: type II toxin-antitoxin system RelE/ParE family toxin [bacterium]